MQDFYLSVVAKIFAIATVYFMYPWLSETAYPKIYVLLSLAKNEVSP